MLQLNSIHCADCLEKMKEIDDKSIDLILADLPYGTTACSWDTIIPFEPLWEAYKRIIKDNGAIVLTASQPFTSALVMSNVKMFKYELIWEKSNPTGMIMANVRPMKYHENILVFYNKQPTYNKQMIERVNKTVSIMKKNNNSFSSSQSDTCLSGKINYTKISAGKYDANLKNPSSVVKINSIRPKSKEYCGHPTQKPVALFEYLIKTYTSVGDTILDNCIGSGTTAVAAINTGRNFIGIEMDAGYCEVANKRIAEARQNIASKLPL